MEATALGQTGLGDATPSDLQTIKTLNSVLFAYGAAMAAGDWTRASMCLHFFQAFWTNVGFEAKRYALAHGATSSAVSGIPDDLTVDGIFGVNTAKVASAVLLLSFGTPASSAAAATPTNASGVALWFQRQVAPLAVPTSAAWFLWQKVQALTTAQLSGDAISRIALAYWNGQTEVIIDPGAPATTTSTPDTSPGTGVAPVPGGLPTTPAPQPTTFAITGVAGATPWWVWAGGAAAVLGVSAGVWYYFGKNRPDLFKSRKRRRR